MTCNVSHTGPWADSPRGAAGAALSDVNLTAVDFIECWHSNDVTYVPVDPAGRWEIHAVVLYSGHRDQYRARLTRMPYVKENL